MHDITSIDSTRGHHRILVSSETLAGVPGSYTKVRIIHKSLAVLNSEPTCHRIVLYAILWLL